MAKWNTFTWSDGTKWVSALGSQLMASSMIDRNGYHVSYRFTHTNTAPPGSLTSCTILSAVAELRIRKARPQGYEAFIDRNTNTQRVSVRVTVTADDTTTAPFALDNLLLLANKRSRRDPS